MIQYQKNSLKGFIFHALFQGNLPYIFFSNKKLNNFFVLVVLNKNFRQNLYKSIFYSIYNNNNPYKIRVKLISANSFQLLLLATDF